MASSGDRKKYLFDLEAQEKIAQGLEKGAQIVGSTLGPGASNVIIDRKHQTPHVVDDGITAIQNLILDDELENLGVKSLVDAAAKASEHAGDGTSTTILLTKAIYDAGRQRVGGGLALGKSPLEIKQEIQEGKKQAVEELKKITSEITSKEELHKVAIAAYADETIAEIVSDMCWKVGENGRVVVEEGWGRDTETEFTEGYQFAGKLADGLFANTPDAGLKLENLPILVTDFDFVNLNDISGIVQEVAKNGEEGLILIANKYQRTAIEQVLKTNIFNTRNKVNFKVHLVKTPSFTPEEFEEMAIFLGARYFNKRKSDKVVEAKLEDLGRASVFQISQAGDGLAIGGGGKEEDIQKRIDWLREKLDKEKVKQIKVNIERRIASLATKIGIIKVASPSEGETEHIRLKTKNAVKSCEAALAEGVVEGGGKALKKVSETLPDGILKEALPHPYEIIQRNGGGDDEVYDAHKVIRTAVEQACSQAWLLINTKTIIAFRNELDLKDVADKVVEAIEKGKK